MKQITLSRPKTTKRTPESWHLPQFINPIFLLSGDPSKYLNSMRKSLRNYLVYLIGMETKHGRNDAYRHTMGNVMDVSDSTISRWSKELEELGFIERWYHNYDSNSYVINPQLYRNYSWYTALSKICAWMPKLVLGLELLSSCGPIFGKLFPDNIYLSLKLTTTDSVSHYGSGAEPAQTTLKKESVVSESQFDEKKGRLCRSIALALIKKGAQFTNDQTLDLYAFDEKVLNRAIGVMKTSKNVQSPAHYFFGLCRTFSREVSSELDLKGVAILRQCNLQLISDAEEAEYANAVVAPLAENAMSSPAASSGFAQRSGPQKREQQATSYNEHVRKTMADEKAAAEARKTPTLPLAEEIASWTEAIKKIEAHIKADPFNPAYSWSLAKAKSKLEELVGKVSSPDASESNTVKEKKP